jgi:hypothetical protein
VYFFFASSSSGYDDHDNLNHGYITTGYRNINAKNNVYINSRTLVNNVHVALASTPLPL